MCFETALSEMSNGRARSVTLSSPSAARRQTMPRWEPSERAAYTSSNAEPSTIRLNIIAPVGCCVQPRLASPRRVTGNPLPIGDLQKGCFEIQDFAVAYRPQVLAAHRVDKRRR